MKKPLRALTSGSLSIHCYCLVAALIVCEKARRASAFTLATSRLGRRQRRGLPVWRESNEQTSTMSGSRLYSELPREASQMGFVHDDPASVSGPHGKKQKRDQSSLLSAVAMDMDATFMGGFAPPVWEEAEPSTDNTATRTPRECWQALWNENIQPVLSSALLITGNTVGASCLVLPEMAARPGLAISTALFAGAYLVNLLSGLLIAEVAIKQHDSSGEDPPASFKDFADANLNLPMAGIFIACISICTNWCIMAFDLTRAGQILSNLNPLLATGAASATAIDPFLMSIAVGVVVAALGMTQDAKNLSGIASMAVTALFASFAGLLLPGLAHVQESPLDVIMTPGTSTNVMNGISQAAPIILMTLVYQNIVPSVTKILNYDRRKVVTAMVLGSALPLCMFLAWCYASIGGGIAVNSSAGAAGPLLTAFSLAAVSGSSIGSVMSISGEIDSFFSQSQFSSCKSNQEEHHETKKTESDSHRFSVPSVFLSVAVPLAAVYMFAEDGHDFTAALSVSGAYGTPLLYGAIPVAMAWTQRQRSSSSVSSSSLQAELNEPFATGDGGVVHRADLVPGGTATLGGLGAGALAFMGQELFQDVSNALASVGAM